MELTQEWLNKFEEKRHLLLCPANLNEYFEKEELHGKKLAVMKIGKVTLPTGQVIVRDPLVYIDKNSKPYFLQVPKGEYETEIAVVLADDGDCDRYAAVRVQFSNNQAVKFEEALVGGENLDTLNEGEYFGFNVDAGLGCICDTQSRDSYVQFEQEFMKKNPDCNMYDDYFAELMEENYNKNPKYQRRGGDWLNWQIPGTQYHIPIFQSGFGDGVYPVYFGYDESGQICQLVIQFIDIKLAYAESDEE